MTIEGQIKAFERNVEEFARTVAGLSARRFLERLNGWTPRDVTAHLVGWNRYVIEGSRQIMGGELPFYDLDPGENYSKVNAVLIREYPSQDRDELLGELRSSAQELREFLEALDPSAWQRDYGVRHRGSTITIRSTVDDLSEDYAHHRRQIGIWQRLAR